MMTNDALHNFGWVSLEIGYSSPCNIHMDDFSYKVSMQYLASSCLIETCQKREDP